MITTIYLFNISLNELLELEKLLQESYGMPSHSPDLLPRSLYIPQFETAVKFFTSILQALKFPSVFSCLFYLLKL